MRTTRPSQTSAMVALFRALADAGFTSAHGFSDPIAKRLLVAPWTWFLQRAESHRAALTDPKWARMREGIDQLALRTLIIDSHVRDALDAGARQLVILGAGLDARAFRMRELAAVDAFEVDHPATQRFKRERVASLTPTASSLHFVPVDFERQSLLNALDSAGFSSRRPTVWIWEGVVMYLSDAGLRATLRAVESRWSPGSSLVVNYSTKTPKPAMERLLLRAWGEPQIGERSRETMQTEIESVGLRVVDDSCMDDWAKRFGASRPPVRTGTKMRVLVAQ